MCSVVDFYGLGPSTQPAKKCPLETKSLPSHSDSSSQHVRTYPDTHTHTHFANYVQQHFSDLGV